MAKSSKGGPRVSDLLRVPSGPVDLSSLDTRATPGFDGGKAAGKAALADLGARLSDLQERLHANGVRGGRSGCCWSSRAWTPRARAG